MESVFKIATLSDLDEILAFAEENHKKSSTNEMERMLQSWHARWRREALEFYLPLGWSFVARVTGSSDHNNPIVGFFLGQPLLFLRAMTQTLWIEYLVGNDLAIRSALADVAIRLAREKHLQRVLFADVKALEGAQKNFSFQELDDEILEVKTTKG